jgi:hypothetical protein
MLSLQISVPKFQVDDAYDEGTSVMRNVNDKEDNRMSYLTVDDTISNGTRRGHNSIQLDPVISTHFSRNSSPSRSRHSVLSVQSDGDGVEQVSFMENLADDMDVSELKADIRSAIHGSENEAGSWLAPVHSKSRNTSKVSLVPSDGDIELQVLKSNDSRSVYEVQGSSGDILSSPKLDTVEGMFRKITARFRYVEGDRFGYKKTRPPILDEEQGLENPFVNTPPRPLKLYGHSLGLFAPFNKVRCHIAKFFLNAWVDHVLASLLLLQTALLSYRQWNPEELNGYVEHGTSWADWALVVINVIYTLEIIGKCIAWGMWDDSQMFLAMNKEYTSFKQILGLKRIKNFFLTDAPDFTLNLKKDALKQTMSFNVSTINNDLPIPRAYLRSSWNRVDFVSSVCFWINFFLGINRSNVTYHISLFRALDCLRILRLTTMTERIGLILKSIKVGAPQLTDVALFFAYFWTLFAIIGVQSFKSSLRRYCVWTNPDDPSDTFESSQHCGGSYYRLSDGSLGRKPYFMATGEPGPRSKGFLCPVNSECRELVNSNQNTYSYDNILNSLQMTFVIMSANTFTDIMYDIMDTESLAASIYFICGLFVLFLWMANLLIAVINSSFQVARESEAFKGKGTEIVEDFDLNFHFVEGWVSKIYSNVKVLFDHATTVSLAFACRRTKFSTSQDIQQEYEIQCIFSVIFLVEIIWRLFCYHPTYKVFFKVKRNVFDLFLVVVTCIIAIPPIHEGLGRGYDWLTVFQIARFYRAVLLIPYVRKLWAKVWGSIHLIFDLSLFYLLLLFVCSIIISRYLEGYTTAGNFESMLFPMNTLPNVFLGLYVITSTENWTEILYNMEGVAPNMISILFMVILIFMWFVLSNTIVFNLFIAIIGDSLSASEKIKRREQVKKFVLVDFPKRLKALTQGSVLKDIRTRVFRSDDDKFRNLEVEKLLLNGAAVQEFLKDELNDEERITEEDTKFYQGSDSRAIRLFREKFRALTGSPARRIIGHLFWDSPEHRNPFLTDVRKNVGLESYTELHSNLQVETQKVDEERRKFLKENPGYNTALYVLRPNHPLRKLCQRIAGPSIGKRYEGVSPNRYANFVFTGIMIGGTVALVLSACISTPLYRNNNQIGGFWNWSFSIELSFGILFLIEFIIKVIADGFIFAPNAYLLSSWNCIDLIVLNSIWINIIAMSKNDEGLSRAVSGQKALRALRFLSISETSRDLFHKVMIAGFWKIISAALLSFTLILPFAVWGLTLFSGRLASCNDGGGYRGCVTEFSTTAFNWDILAPRVYDSPQLELNKFSSSLLTLFEVLSLEGWTDLLENMVNSTGVGTPMSHFASPENAIFIVIFIFIGIVFSLTLFISVIISNYARLSGSAFLTLQQRAWGEVKKLLIQAAPRQRPEKLHLNRFRKFCFDYGVERSRATVAFLQFVLWVHILAILLEMYPSEQALDIFRYTVYFTSSTILLISNLMILIAMGPKKFVKVRWNIYEFAVYVGAFSTSFASFFVSRGTVFANINKLFLVGIFTMLIHMSNRLSHLLKIASASLPSLFSLVYTWAVLFLVFAIALNQIFGLTKVGPNTTGAMNVRTVPKALILLFRNSFGEAWNYTMKDFGVESPYCTNSGIFNSTDCGSMEYSYIIFILWNIISMYIFVNMCISLIFENFSYVYSDNSGTVVLTRDEIRRFKTVWSEFDPKGTGFISLEQLSAFLQTLEGYFSFKVYEGQWTIPQLKKQFFKSPDMRQGVYDVEVDIEGLNRMLNRLDVAKAKNRLFFHEMLFEESKFNMERYEEEGVSFQRLILLIPLYSKFDMNNCLQLTDFLDRLVLSRKLNERLKNRRNLEALKTIVYRWRYLKVTRGGLTNQKINGDGWDSNDDMGRFEDDYSDYGYEFDTPFSPQFGRYSKIRTPRSSMDKIMDNSYWSPTRSRSPCNSDDEILGEISGIADDLKHSLWKDELMGVGQDLSSFLAKRKTGTISSETDSEDITADHYEVDYDTKGQGKII